MRRVMKSITILISLQLAHVGGFQISSFPDAAVETMSIIIDKAGYASVKSGRSSNAVAWGSFNDMIEKTGWAVLDVHTTPTESGRRQSYAAGFLEGFLTQERMAQHLQNIWSVDFKRRSVGQTPANISQFVAHNLRWMQQQVRVNPDDEYWVMTGWLLEQLRGMRDGYAAALHKHDALTSQVWLPSLVDTDMDDLVVAIAGHSDFMNHHIRSNSKSHKGHCSALIQIAPENSDLWVGHTTWDAYRTMLRVVKYFDLPLPGTASRRVAFTSFPGSMYSEDDFYVTDAGLTIVETSITNHNKSLWEHVRPESVFTWARVTLANRLAATGAEWTDVGLRHQSGTYNNQWMVVDYKRFVPGKPLRDGTLWVAEAVPGHSHRADVTDVLVGQRSWPSYNIPYFHHMWKVAGYGAMQKMNPSRSDEYSFTGDTRARIFARARADGWVTDLPSFMELLRYNRRDDPLAQGNACKGISARCDLNAQDKPEYDCFGGIDAKVTQWRPDIRDLSFFAVSSPTRSSSARPFIWSQQNASVDGCRPSEHIGHPDTFDYPWYLLPAPYGDKTITSTRPLRAGWALVVLLLIVSMTIIAKLVHRGHDNGSFLVSSPSSTVSTPYSKL